MPAMTDAVAALGFRVHSGWAAMVAVAGRPASPMLVARRRIELADRTPAQPYHEAARLAEPQAAAAAIERARSEAAQKARLVVSAAIADARHRGYRVERAAILVGRTHLLQPLEQILASHPLLHTAEGILFRDCLAEGCSSSGLSVSTFPERDVQEDSRRVLALTAAAMRQLLSDLGRAAGSPWTADYKDAALAACRALAATTPPAFHHPSR